MDTKQSQTPALVTIKQAMAYLNIGTSSVYRLIGEGKLRKVKIGSATRIARDSIEAFASSTGG